MESASLKTNHVKLEPVIVKGKEYFRLYITIPDKDMFDHFYALIPKPMVDFIVDVLKLLDFTVEVLKEPIPTKA